MRRTPTLLGVALVAAATASAVAVTSGSAQAPAGTTLTFVEHERDAQSVVADAPPLNRRRQLLGKGDTGLFPSDVLDAAGTAKVGRLGIRCTFEKVTPRFRGSRAVCDGAYALRGGQLTIQAYVTFDPGTPTTFAVTGGTGAYAGVHGSGVNTPRSAQSPISDTVITLVP